MGNADKYRAGARSAPPVVAAEEDVVDAPVTGHLDGPCPLGAQPESVSSTTVTLTEMAEAVDGIPQSPATGKVRVPFATSAGLPTGPAGVRVSTTRHGFTV